MAAGGPGGANGRVGPEGGGRLGGALRVHKIWSFGLKLPPAPQLKWKRPLLPARKQPSGHVPSPGHGPPLLRDGCRARYRSLHGSLRRH